MPKAGYFRTAFVKELDAIIKSLGIKETSLANVFNSKANPILS